MVDGIIAQMQSSFYAEGKLNSFDSTGLLFFFFLSLSGRKLEDSYSLLWGVTRY